MREDDFALREALKHLAPTVGESGVWDSLQPRVAAKRRAHRRRLAFGGVAVIVIACLGFGAYGISQWWPQGDNVLVIIDDTVGMSPGLTGPATATTVTSVQTTTAASPTTTQPAGPGTTDSPFALETRLPNGHFRGLVFIYGMVDGMDVFGGYQQIKVDYLEMLTGEEAEAAALEDGVISPGEDLPDDYYIRNATTWDEEYGTPTDKTGPGFMVYKTASITTYTFGDGGEQAITWEQFVSFWHPISPPEGGEHMCDVPWWIERDERGYVVSITELQLP